MIVQRTTHRIGRLLTGRSQDTHSSSKVRLKVGADGHGNVAEAGHNSNLNLTIEHRALQTLEEYRHEGVAIGSSLFSESSANVPDETNCDRAKLRVLVGLQCRAQIRSKSIQVRVESSLQCWKMV